MSWAIILAGGEGTRLAEAARKRYGYARPKQFCDFDGRGTLLGRAIARASRVAPPQRVLVATTRQHRVFADEVLASRSVRQVEQPTNRGTAPGLLLPLLHVLREDPNGVVVMLPADHHVANEAMFDAALQRASAFARQQPSCVALVGATPDGDDDGYGWVIPGDDEQGVATVTAFREKPPADERARLRAGGALVNTFVVVARASTLAAALARHVPGWWRAMRDCERDPARLDALFDVAPPADLSAHVLERIPEQLRVVRLPAEAGWSDVGTPARLARIVRPTATRRPADG